MKTPLSVLTAALLAGIPLQAEEELPVATMSITLVTLGLGAVFLLYRYLKSLQTHLNRCDAIVRNLPLPLLWCGKEGHILGINSLLTEHLGFAPRQLKGRRWFERLMPDETALKARHRLLSRDGAPVSFEAPVLDSAGKAHWAIWHIGRSETVTVIVVELWVK